MNTPVDDHEAWTALEFKAGKLLARAQSYSMYLRGELTKDSPLVVATIDQRGILAFDFVLAAACTAIAMSSIAGDIPEEWWKKLFEVPFDRGRWNRGNPEDLGDMAEMARLLNLRMDQWYESGKDATLQCMNYITHTLQQGTFSRLDQQTAYAAALGSWILTSHWGPEKGSSELELATRIGWAICAEFTNYWA